MQEIKTVIRSPYEPNDVHALWIDTSNIDSPVAKVHEKGKWQGVGGDGGGGGQSLFPIIDLTHANIGKIKDAYVNDPDSRIGKDKFAHYLGITVDELDLLFTADFSAVKVLKNRDTVVIQYLRASAYFNTLVVKDYFDGLTFYMDSAGPYYGMNVMMEQESEHQ